MNTIIHEWVDPTLGWQVELIDASHDEGFDHLARIVGNESAIGLLSVLDEAGSVYDGRNIFVNANYQGAEQ